MTPSAASSRDACVTGHFGSLQVRAISALIVTCRDVFLRYQRNRAHTHMRTPQPIWGNTSNTSRHTDGNDLETGGTP